jgi:predicted RNase H-like HicB family nuclease
MTTLRQFAHIINWSDEDQCYIGTVPSMPGCMATGDTIESTMEQLEAAKREWRDEAERLKTQSD